MAEPKSTIKAIFAPIAQREVDFYLALALQLRQTHNLVDVEFISFYQSANDAIRRAGFKVWDLYKKNTEIEAVSLSDNKLEQIFNIKNIHKLCLHEKVTFNLTNYSKLYSKFGTYLMALEKVITEIKTSNPIQKIVVFQELGGFIAPMALFFACRKNNIQHVFFEPSFFLGKMHFLTNNYFLSFGNISKIKEPTNPAVVTQLEGLRKKQSLVIPKKDVHHYQDMGLTKIFNKRNIRQLFSKLYIKYVLKQKQEYEHVWKQVIAAAKQYINRLKLSKCYTNEIPTSPFVYFPLHVALDFQLTVRDPEYLDQLGFINYLCSILPKGLKFVVKEHPISVGGMDARRLKNMLQQFDNLVLLNPMINTYKILEKTDGVITISSKVGAEAIVLGKPVACVGHGFYCDSGLVTQINEPGKIEDWFIQLINGRDLAPAKAQVDAYFSEIYRQAFPFELYNLSAENVGRFKESVVSFFETLPPTTTNPIPLEGV